MRDDGGMIALARCAQSGAQLPESLTDAQNRELLFQLSLLQSLTEGDFEVGVTVEALK